MGAGSALALGLLAAVPSCAGDMDQPGQVNYRATLTVLNRTTAPLQVWSGTERFEVLPCDEVTREGFPINWWNVTSPGRDTLHGGGGFDGRQSYLVVTSVVTQQDERPDPMPPCEGLLQR